MGTVEIEAYGLLLRPWRHADAEPLLRGLNDPEFLRWNTLTAEVADPADARAYVDGLSQGWESGDTATFAILRDGVVCGSVGLALVNREVGNAWIGYWTLPEARGRRIASRGLEVCSRWAFEELGLLRLELGHAVGNDASCAVAGHCGYRDEGVLDGVLPDPAGGFRPMHRHARLAVDPPSEPGSALR